MSDTIVIRSAAEVAATRGLYPWFASTASDQATLDYCCPDKLAYWQFCRREHKALVARRSNYAGGCTGIAYDSPHWDAVGQSRKRLAAAFDALRAAFTYANRYDDILDTVDCFELAIA